jgi:uncharacterized metal-binding protein YceD (DUF177 family)
MNKEYLIPFEGLKLGKHPYSFDISDTFFENLEYSLIDRGEVHVSMELEKKEQMMSAFIKMNGAIWSACDRCTEPMRVPIAVDHTVIFKFGEGQSDDEDLILLEPSEFEIDMAPIFYELITVSLPSKVLHEEGDCNEEMLDLLDQYSGFTYEDDEDDEDDDVDPRWNALKDLNK